MRSKRVERYEHKIVMQSIEQGHSAKFESGCEGSGREGSLAKLALSKWRSLAVVVMCRADREEKCQRGLY